MKKILLLVSLSAVLLSCRPAQTASIEKSPIDGVWQLTYVAGTNSLDQLYSGRKPIITFKEGKISGNNGCNGFSGDLNIKGDKINFDRSKIISTMMACEGNGESTFMKALYQVDHYASADGGKTLNLLHGQTTVMRFEKQ